MYICSNLWIFSPILDEQLAKEGPKGNIEQILHDENFCPLFELALYLSFFIVLIFDFFFSGEETPPGGPRQESGKDSERRVGEARAVLLRGAAANPANFRSCAAGQFMQI